MANAVNGVRLRCRNALRTALPLVFSLSIAACGGGDAAGPSSAPTASVSGTVREVPGGGPVAGATVTVGNVSVTTGSDGRFQLQNAPIGASVTIIVSAPGFDAYSQTIAVQAGQNSHDVALARKTIYESANRNIYLPPNIATYRGVILDLPGGNSDSRPLIRGNLAFYQAFPLYGDVTEYRRRLLLFAEQQQFGIMGSRTFFGDENPAATYADILTALASFATQSGHAELASVPLLLYGHSLGACAAYDFTRLNSDRVIGFISGKASCLTLIGSAGARSVPGYFLIGEDDAPATHSNSTQVFEAGRAEGAPWALAIEPEADHTRTSNFDVLFNWMAALTAQRLTPAGAAGQPVQLRAISEASGWLGNRSSGAVAGFTCYTGNKSLASWLPSEQTARDWQVMIGKAAEVTSC